MEDMMELPYRNDKHELFRFIATEKEKEDFRIRMFMLTLEKSTQAIKVVFDSEIHPDQLERVLSKNSKKLQKLYQRKTLTSQQWDKLFPGQGSITVSSNTFDITLMTCLLRNLTDVQISDRLPFSEDISTNADISRLLYYRNMISHIANDDQSNYSKFDAALDDCIQAIHRLSGMDCNDYKTKQFGDGSKDCRVVIDALIFLYREGCDLGRIGLFCAFWELTHIEQMEALLGLCVYYQLLEPIVLPLWEGLIEGKQLGVLDRFLNECDTTAQVPTWEVFPSRSVTDAYRAEKRRNFNYICLNEYDTKGQVPTWEVFPSRSVTDAYWAEERRNSYFLCSASSKINRCAFNNRKSKDEDEMELPRSNSSECCFTDTYGCFDENEISAASSAYSGNEESIFEAVFSSFSFSDLLSYAGNCVISSLLNPENYLYLAMAVAPNEFVLNNSLPMSCGTDLA